jgi:hypothetical protein
MDNYKEIIFVIVSAMLLNYAYNKFPLLTFKEGMTPSIDIEGEDEDEDEDDEEGKSKSGKRELHRAWRKRPGEDDAAAAAAAASAAETDIDGQTNANAESLEDQSISQIFYNFFINETDEEAEEEEGKKKDKKKKKKRKNRSNNSSFNAIFKLIDSISKFIACFMKLPLFSKVLFIIVGPVSLILQLLGKILIETLLFLSPSDNLDSNIKSNSSTIRYNAWIIFSFAFITLGPIFASFNLMRRFIFWMFGYGSEFIPSKEPLDITKFAPINDIIDFLVNILSSYFNLKYLLIFMVLLTIILSVTYNILKYYSFLLASLMICIICMIGILKKNSSDNDRKLIRLGRDIGYYMSIILLPSLLVYILLKKELNKILKCNKKLKKVSKTLGKI